MAAKFRRDNGLTSRAADCFVAAGGKQIIFNAMMATLNPGDEVVIPAPYWVSYPEIVRLCGGDPVYAVAGCRDRLQAGRPRCSRRRSRQDQVADPQHALEPDRRGLYRPTSSGIADVLLRHPQVYILTDDIYEMLVYDGGKFATIAAGRAGAARAHADDERRVEVARDDRLAHRLLHRARAAARRDG